MEDLTNELLDRLAKEVPDNWKDLGLGSVTDSSQNVAYYRVVDWPACNTFRQSLGLEPSTFHITVGFYKSDIHNACKDSTTLFSAAAAAAAQVTEATDSM
jgi:Swiss Army Knife, 2H phosphoesterase domain